jgi:mono/diheme cytochrome c family protein
MRSWPRPVRRRVAAIFLAAGVATSVAACGGSSSAAAGGDSPTSTSQASTSQASTSATTHGSSTAAQTSTASSGGSGSSSAAGLAVFASAGCGSCHTLAAAHATGDVGPNLDDLKPSEALVAHQVTNGGAAMPSFAGRLSKAQITAVAKFVASAAG